MPPLYLLLLVFLLGCATGGLFMALLRRRAIEQVRREFEEQMQEQWTAKGIAMERRLEPHPRAYDA